MLNLLLYNRLHPARLLQPLPLSSQHFRYLYDTVPATASNYSRHLRQDSELHHPPPVNLSP